MKITPLRTVVLACSAFAILFVSSGKASAIDIGIRVGTPPPPPVEEHPWARPDAGAVWIAGHHEWVDGRWVWISGYYTYPEHHGAHWVPAHYHDGRYYPGHWD